MDLINELLKRKVIDKKKAEELREKKDIEETLLKERVISEKELFKLKSQILKIPFKEEISGEISYEILKLIPKESASYYKIIPLSKSKEGVLEIGTPYPENIEAQEALKFLARQQKISYKICLITLSDFKKYLEKYKVPEREMEQLLERLKTETVKAEAEIGAVSKEKFERLVEEAPVVKMVSVILRQAIEGKASDIHIEPTIDKLRIRYRLDGILHSSLFLPIKAHLAIVARIKILAGLKIDETRIPQDGRFTMDFNGKYIDFRVSTFPTSLGEKAALRVLNPLEGLKQLEGLGLTERDYKLIEKAMKKPYGMILATGPTGCGKTTTLYSILSILNTEKVNIITLEDPIEYFMAGVNQSQVKPEIGYTFAKGLRQILRQDPNIIMVGEIRDEETANLAIHAALTGHLVLSTLHTNNVLGVIPRLIDMGIVPFLIPTTLTLAFTQRLIRMLCPECKKRIFPPPKIKEEIFKKIKSISEETGQVVKIKEPFYIYEPQGCKECNFTGYKGRIGIFEVLEMTENLAAIIISAKPSETEIFKEARAQKMVTIEENGILKVLDGITSYEEIIRVSKEK